MRLRLKLRKLLKKFDQNFLAVFLIKYFRDSENFLFTSN